MPLTVPNLDDRNFDDLYREVVARVPVHTPEWTNLGESDPGVTLLQLFAHLADNLSYRSNRIPEATRRAFLTLLGVPLQPATPAVGFVTVTAEATDVTVPAGTVVRAGKTQFRTRRTVHALPLETHVFWKRARTDLDADTLEHLQRLHAPLLGQTPQSQLSFYDPVQVAAPAAGVPLPVVDLADRTTGPVDGAVWVALTASKTAVRLAAGDPRKAAADLVPAVAGKTLTLGLVPAATSEGRVLEPDRAVTAPADPGLIVEASAAGGVPSYRRLTVTHAEDVFARPGVLDVVLPAREDMTGPWITGASTEGTSDLPPLVEDRTLAARIVTWLRIRRRGTGTMTGSGGATLSWVGGNVAHVVQAVRVDRERLAVGTGAPDQRVQVAHVPVLLGDEQRTSSSARTGSGSTDWDPQTGPRVEVQDEAGQWHEWHRTATLPAAGPDDAVWAIDPEAGVITFGSGLHGRRPPRGSGIRATYEYGGGPQGLVPIDAIDKIDLAGVKVANPLPTTGGVAGETIAAAERAIPAWIRHRDRAVTADDFHDIIMRTPGVDLARVDVVPSFDPRPTATTPNDAAGTVTVMVVPRDHVTAPTPPPTVDRYVLETVCRWIDPRRLITTEVHVRGPTWIPIVVSVGIALMPGEVREEVEQRTRAAIRAHLSPLSGGIADRTGITVEETGASPVGWPLGVAVRTDDLAAAATRVAGVRYVEGVRLSVTRNGTTSTDVTEVTMSGLELPFATVFVGVGHPEDPADLSGTSQAAPTTYPVPVIPKKC